MTNKPDRVCMVCGNKLSRQKMKYCSMSCYKSVPISESARLKMSAARKGKPTGPRPRSAGELNPNYKGKAQTPAVMEKMRAAIARRGSTQTPEKSAAQREKMLGPANGMRGLRHTDETRRKISETKKSQYVRGIVKTNRYKISEPERRIARWLTDHNVDFSQQYHIEGVPYTYDFCLHNTKTIIEFNGDYWHANPRRHPAGSVLYYQGGERRTVESIWSRDADKRRQAEESGFSVVYIWEMDFKRDGVALLEKVFGSVDGLNLDKITRSVLVLTSDQTVRARRRKRTMTTPTDKGRASLEARLDATAVQESLTVEPAQEQAALAAASAASMDRVALGMLATLTPAERAILAKRLAAKP